MNWPGLADTGFGDITVRLETDGDTADCDFDRDHKAELAGRRPGQRITIRGKCKGIVLGFVTQEKCIRS